MSSAPWVDLDTAPLATLVAHLDDNNPLERADAACALGDRLRTRELRALDAEVQARLVALLRDLDPAVRLEAAIALAEVHDARATDVLLAAIRVRALRLDAIRALGTLGNRSAAPPLLELMQRWLLPWADRLQAAAALCALGDAEGATFLAHKLLSRRRAERAAAIHFMGESRHPRARAILEVILADAKDGMRDVAARALGLLGDAAAAPALRAARAQADKELCADIDEALARLEQG